MPEAILVLNAGSSSIKFSVYVAGQERPALAFRGQVEGLYTNPRFVARSAEGESLGKKVWPEGEKLGHEGAIDFLSVFLREHRGNLLLAGVGHRVCHGGLSYSHPVRIDKEVVADLEKLIPLAPLHQPHNLAPIRIVLERMPQIPQVACFDTAFHRSNPTLAQMYAIPQSFTDAGVRRYGFHGLSYEYISSVLPKRVPKAASGKCIVLHLGNGSSMCAMDGGRSVASTMGFSTLDGLAMGTRCGSLDPGVVLFLMQNHKMDAAAIEKLLYKESGLLGVSGVSSDVRELLASKAPKAQLALDLFVYRITRELGSLTAALSGLDAVIFTGGIGENAAGIREKVCRNAAWLGVEVDSAANTKPGEACISTKNSRVQAWVIRTDEEIMIAQHTLSLLGKARTEAQA